LSAKPCIALFLPDLASGGAERVLLSLADYLVIAGYRVTMVLGRAEGEFIKQIPPGVRVIDLSARWRLPSLAGLALNCFFGLMMFIRRERPTVLMSSLSRANIVATLAARIAGTGVRVVLREANTFHNVGRFTLFLIKRVYPMADAVVSVSNGIAGDLYTLEKLPRDKVRIIYNPVDIEKVRKLAMQELDHAWFAPASPPVILGVGRLAPQKDFGLLIRAFTQLRKVRDARLLILGEGEERASLEALVDKLGMGEHVSMPGYVDNPYMYIRRAGIVAVSSRWEGMINVIIEAIALGTTVVSTDCHSGPAEILDNGRIGKLVEVGNADALCRAMISMLDRPDDCESLRSRAAEFSTHKILPQYAKLLLDG
jgi:glycosyltransferase involved in cell wall biosynthesis